MTASSDRLWGVASGLGAGAMWGLVFLAPKFAPEASPLLLTAGRYLAYGLIAVVLIAPRWRRLAPLIEAGDRYLSFLPMSHSYEHTVGGFLMPSFGTRFDRTYKA